MTQNKNILITGATGLIGQALVPFLVSLGYNISILSRNKEKAIKLFGSSVKVYEWPNEHSNVTWAKHIKIDVIINLAGANVGEKRWTKKYKQILITSRMNSIAVLNSIVQQMNCEPKLWLQASAIGFYGASILQLTDEDGAKGKGFLADLVSQWENTCDKILIQEINKVYMRFGLVLSEKGGFLKEMKRLLRYGVAVCPGNGFNYLSMIKIEYLLNAIAHIIESNNYSGPINFVSEKPIKTLDFIHRLKQESNAKVTLKIPSFALRILVGREKTEELILANQKIETSVISSDAFYTKPQNLKLI